MAEKVRMPKISANVEEAVLTAWLKDEGADVDKGEIIAEITTDKGVTELEAPVHGTLLRQLVGEGSTVPVTYILGIIGAAGEAFSDVTDENGRILAAHKSKAAGTEHPRRKVRKAKRQRVRATPAARRLARRYGLELEEVRKTMQVDTVDENSIRNFMESRSQ